MFFALALLLNALSFREACQRVYTEVFAVEPHSVSLQSPKLSVITKKFKDKYRNTDSKNFRRNTDRMCVSLPLYRTFSHWIDPATFLGLPFDHFFMTGSFMQIYLVIESVKLCVTLIWNFPTLLLFLARLWHSIFNCSREVTELLLWCIPLWT